MKELCHACGMMHLGIEWCAAYFSAETYDEHGNCDPSECDEVGWQTADPFSNPPRRGALVRVRDGREGRVVYHGLDGYGLRWEDADESKPPEALLREPYATAQAECVGREFKYAESESRSSAGRAE